MLRYFKERRAQKEKARKIERQSMPHDLACALGIVQGIYGDEGVKRWHEKQKEESRVARGQREILGDERFKEKLRGAK